MSKKWHKGPPPSVGWWPASAVRSESVLRWWDGVNWSWGCSVDKSAKEAGEKAASKSRLARADIEWRHRPKSWPKRSHT